MKVFPVINCKDFRSAKEKLKEAAKFLPKNGWVQMDISDGKFTKAKTKITPLDLKLLNIIAKKHKLNLEVHLMVKNPEKVVEEWFRAGAKRVIAHVEEINSTNNQRLTTNNKIGLAINPNTPIKKLFPYLKKIKFVQFLAVNPGYSSQKFDKRILKKIKQLKAKNPRIKIEIDGGINLETAKLVKKAGADIIVSGSYIWNSKSPGKIYRELSTVR